MTMKNIFLLLVLSISLVGCISYEPIPKGYVGPTSTIKDTSEAVSSKKVYFYELEKVDGRRVSTSSLETSSASYGQGFTINLVETERDIPAFTTVLLLKGATYFAAPILALGGGSYSVEGEVTVNLEPNTKYFVKGTLSKEYSAIWLEDDNGNVASKKIEKNRK